MRPRHLFVRSAAFAALSLFAGLAAAAPIAADWTQRCSPALCPPDLTVRAEGGTVWRWSTDTQSWLQEWAQGFRVANVGSNPAGAFRVDVLQGAASHAFTIDGLAAGASQWFENDVDCGQSATIVVNPNNELSETDYTNNTAVISGWCNW